MSIKKRYYLVAVKGILIGLLVPIIFLSLIWIKTLKHNVAMAGSMDSTEILISSLLLCGGIGIIIALLILHKVSKT
jgi:hypothetical protein